jgi:gluconate 5-dehydrogenase
LATAVRLAREPGARIVLNGRDAGRGEAARAKLQQLAPGAAIAFVAADVSDRNQVSALVTRACDHLEGPIDALVNAAGGDFVPTLFHETPLAEIEAIVRHWLLSTMYCCSLALPRMNDGGAIVNVASDAAKAPTPGEAVVGAAMLESRCSRVHWRWRRNAGGCGSMSSRPRWCATRRPLRA